MTLIFSDETSSIKTETSQFSNATGLTGWRWELAYLYTDCMTSLCMSGQTSAIQKTALLGSEAKRRVAIFSEGNTTSKEGLGLLDLLKIKFPIEEGKNWVSPKMTLKPFLFESISWHSHCRDH